eukprot:11337483-Ditylum_brightwellii.AAC.1
MSEQAGSICCAEDLAVSFRETESAPVAESSGRTSQTAEYDCKQSQEGQPSHDLVPASGKSERKCTFHEARAAE